MKINKLNYETFVIDYLEGQLSADDRRAFERFVEEHPEVRAEMDAFLQAPILTEDEGVVYSQKAKSKKRGSVLYWVLGGVLVLMLGTGVWMFSSPSEDIQEVPSPIHQEDARVLPLATQDYPEKSLESEMPEQVVQEKLSIENHNTTDTKIASAPLQFAEINDKMKGNVKQNLQVPTEVNGQPNQLLSSEIVSQTENIAAAPQVAENRISKTRQGDTKVESRAILPAVQALAEISTRTDLSEPRIVELVATVTSKINTKEKKKIGWRKLLTPQSYEDIDLRTALVSQTLKSAVEDTEKTFVPEILLTK